MGTPLREARSFIRVAENGSEQVYKHGMPFALFHRFDHVWQHTHPNISKDVYENMPSIRTVRIRSKDHA